MTCDGFTYEREAIETWLSTSNINPITGAVLESKILVPNYGACPPPLSFFFFHNLLTRIKQRFTNIHPLNTVTHTSRLSLKHMYFTYNLTQLYVKWPRNWWEQASHNSKPFDDWCRYWDGSQTPLTFVSFSRLAYATATAAASSTKTSLAKKDPLISSSRLSREHLLGRQPQAEYSHARVKGFKFKPLRNVGNIMSWLATRHKSDHSLYTGLEWNNLLVIESSFDGAIFPLLIPKSERSSYPMAAAYADVIQKRTDLIQIEAGSCLVKRLE